MNFTDYAAQRGCKLLKDDLSFIRRQLKCVQRSQIKAVMLRYIDEWCNGMDNAKNAITAQNEGRKAANLFLRNVTQ